MSARHRRATARVKDALCDGVLQSINFERSGARTPCFALACSLALSNHSCVRVSLLPRITAPP